LLAALLVAAGCNGMFFQPNAVGYSYPYQFGLWHEDVFFASGDGTRLTGWFLPAQGRPRGTVIHFHGNGANISNHLPVVRWLPAAGYAVFLFDYRGYGVSEGEPSRAGVIEDGVAALAYVRGRKDVDPQRLVVFGQSLGAAVAVSALARAGTAGVRALVLEGSFASYREVVRLILDDSWLTWLFQYPVAYLLFSDELSPLEDLPAVAGVPLLVVHGERDRMVPFANGRALFDAFPGPDKTFWAIPLGGHIGAFVQDGSPWRKSLLAYLERKLGPLPPEGFRFRSPEPAGVVK
jgi:fermentation-respiration switch protein FrsA (DUF1100 family)